MSAATSFTNGDLFSCKISLKYCKSPVWRRVLVPVNYTFKDLHDVIMAAMEWDGYHLHMFKFKHPIFGDKIEINGPGALEQSDQEDDNICYLPESTLVASYVKRLKQKIQYEYDFGCSWEHVIEFEKIVNASCNLKYPRCIKGKGMPPPEDDPDSERSEFFDWMRINSKLNKCRQYVKVLKPSALNSVSEKHSSTPANESTVEKELDELPAKKGAFDTDQPSTSSPIPVATNLQTNKAVGSNKHSSKPTNQSTVRKELDEPPAKKRAFDTDQPSTSSSIPVETNLQNDKAVDSNNPSFVLPPSSPEKYFSTIPSVYANAINNSPVRSDELTSRCVECEEKGAIMDYEDFYGKYVATNLKLLADGKMRANLRYDIQLAINKYSKFLKQT